MVERVGHREHQRVAAGAAPLGTAPFGATKLDCHRHRAGAPQETRAQPLKQHGSVWILFRHHHGNTEHVGPGFRQCTLGDKAELHKRL
jgi:hypothetical protein